MTLALLAIGILVVLTCLLWRLALLDDCTLKEGFLGLGGNGSFAGVDEQEARVIALARCSSHSLPWSPAIVTGIIIGLGYLWFIKIHSLASIDGPWFDGLLLLGGLLLDVLLAVVFLRLLLLWSALRNLLRRLFFHPTRGCYDEFHDATLPNHPENQRIIVFEPRPTYTAVEYCLARARDIAKLAEAPKEEFAQGMQDVRLPLAKMIRLAECRLLRMNLVESSGDERTILESRRKLQVTMGRLANKIVTAFEPAWRLGWRSVPIAPPRNQKESDSQDPMLMQQAELFIAGRVVDFLRQVFPHILNLIGFGMVGLVALMLAASAYPFPARDTILWISWVALFAGVGVSLYVLVGINRDRIISMISGTAPGRITWDSAFVTHLVVFVLIPVLTLIGAQYPHALGSVFSWMGNALGKGSDG
jgi:hypothetical protein